jgi:8-oxo-dGTP pyrophosphatase MutT (NUDIX family)
MPTAQTVVELYCCRLRTDVGAQTYPFLPPSSSGTILISTRAAEGAARETWEEARARVSILAPYAHYDIPRIGQVRHDLPGSHHFRSACQTLTCSSSHPVTLLGAKHLHE